MILAQLLVILNKALSTFKNLWGTSNLGWSITKTSFVKLGLTYKRNIEIGMITTPKLKTKIGTKIKLNTKLCSTHPTKTTDKYLTKKKNTANRV